MHSKTIESSVQEISNISQSALLNFDTLKYRKINIEALITTMTAFLELRRILPLLDNCATNKNVDEANRHMKNYQTFHLHLIPEFNKVIQSYIYNKHIHFYVEYTIWQGIQRQSFIFIWKYIIAFNFN